MNTFINITKKSEYGFSIYSKQFLVIEKLIDKPSNALKLTVKLTDINGQESEFIKEFDVVDSNRPTIMADVVTIDSETKLKIVAQDDIAISYLTYQWTDGEEVRILHLLLYS